MQSRKTIYLILLFSTVSLSAQNFILNAKYNKSFNSRIDSKFIIEGLLSFNNNRFDIGLFLGATNVEVNEISHSTNKVAKGIYGITSYYYPFNKEDYSKILSILFLSLKIAKVRDKTLDIYGRLPSDNVRYSINSENDKLFTFSVGGKADFYFVNIICEIGYQHRMYDFTYTLFEEDGNSGLLKKQIAKSEDSIFIEIGLQLVL